MQVESPGKSLHKFLWVYQEVPDAQISMAPKVELLCGSCVLHASLNSAELFYFLLLLLQALNFDRHSMEKPPVSHSLFTLPVALTLSTVLLIRRDAPAVSQAEHFGG